MSNANISRQNTLNNVLGTLQQRRADVEAFLAGSGLSYEAFFATISQALRKYPKLLDCELRSLVNACMEAAHDGLRIDGKEAAIVEYETTFGKGTKAERTVKLAEYTPMAYGMIQQILRGGEVFAMEADVIHENDEYDVQSGTDPHIFHRPNLTGDRGQILAGYSVATLKNGVKTFELVDRAQLAAIRACAKTDKAWKVWPGEQSKKSAIRRHRKRLPLGDRNLVIHDAEAARLYGDIDDDRALPPPQQQPPRPTRAAIADQAGTAAGTPLDLQEEEEAVIIEGTAEEKREGKPKPAKPRKSTKAEQDSAVDTARQMDADESGTGAQNMQETMHADEAIPEDDAAWRGWVLDVERKLREAGDADAVNAIAKAEESRIAAASEQRADWVRSSIADRLTDFATGKAE
jgi:recombination protein RecT